LEKVILLNRSEMKKFVQSLSANEAARVLKDMVGRDPGLTQKAYEIALKVAGDVDADAIMDTVFSRLDRLDMDDLNGRAGRTRYGYVEPTEAAWQIFEEALDPFIDEMKRNQKRGLPAVAKAHCIGIVMGLLEYEKASSSDFAGWVEDAPGEYIGTVVEEWKKGNPSSEDIAEVMSIAWGDQS
jgi:hypothetical protein